MLPRSARLRHSDDFARVSRRGYRGAAGSLVVHLLDSVPGSGVRVGYVVSKKVGNSVVRHRVVRRLRAVTVPLLNELPDDSQIVVRALPAAAQADSGTLATDLAAAARNASRRRRRWVQPEPVSAG